jgi:hypothetical protein
LNSEPNFIPPYCLGLLRRVFLCFIERYNSIIEYTHKILL